MKIDYDPNKSEKNRIERGFGFDLADDFEWDTARYWVDRRKNYGEVRYFGYGMIEERLHAICFKEIEEGIRVISLRKANTREQKFYQSLFQTDDDTGRDDTGGHI